MRALLGAGISFATSFIVVASAAAWHYVDKYQAAMEQACEGSTDCSIQFPVWKAVVGSLLMAFGAAAMISLTRLGQPRWPAQDPLYRYDALVSGLLGVLVVWTFRALPNGLIIGPMFVSWLGVRILPALAAWIVSAPRKTAPDTRAQRDPTSTEWKEVAVALTDLAFGLVLSRLALPVGIATTVMAWWILDCHIGESILGGLGIGLALSSLKE